MTIEPSTVSRRADAAENDAIIVAAAARMITLNGGIPSIRDVAREAGVGSTTVYRRFATKAALHSRAIAVIICDRIGPTIAHALQDPDPMHGLREVTDELIRATNSPERVQVTLPDLVNEFLVRYREDLTVMMEAAQAAGELRSDIVREDIDGITTVMFAGLALPKHRAGASARYVALIFDGLSRIDAAPLPGSS